MIGKILVLALAITNYIDYDYDLFFLDNENETQLDDIIINAVAIWPAAGQIEREAFYPFAKLDK